MDRLLSQKMLGAFALAVGLSLLGLYLPPPPTLAHGEGPMMKLSHSQMPPGDTVAIEAEGFEGAKSVEVVIKGTRGEIPLGMYKVGGEEFTLKVTLPQDLRPGPYELILRSGDEVAKERIRIMPGMMGGTGMGMGGMGPAGGMMGRGMQTAEPPTADEASAGQAETASGEAAPPDGGPSESKASSPVQPAATSPPLVSQSATPPPPVGQPAVAVERPGWLTLTVWLLVVLLVGGGGYLMGLASKLTKTLGEG